MTTSPLFERGPAPAAECPRCGRMFEVPIEIEGEGGEPTRIRGHIQGDPVLCIPLPSLASIRGAGRDARARRNGRRGA